MGLDVVVNGFVPFLFLALESSLFKPLEKVKRRKARKIFDDIIKPYQAFIYT
jgi:hypothetical protein